MSLRSTVRRSFPASLAPALLLSTLAFLPSSVGAAPAPSPAPAKVALAKHLKAPQATPAARPALLAAGTLAPDFTVQDKKGAPVKLSDYKGKVVVLECV